MSLCSTAGRFISGEAELCFFLVNLHFLQDYTQPVQFLPQARLRTSYLCQFVVVGFGIVRVEGLSRNLMHE